MTTGVRFQGQYTWICKTHKGLKTSDSKYMLTQLNVVCDSNFSKHPLVEISANCDSSGSLNLTGCYNNSNYPTSEEVS